MNAVIDAVRKKYPDYANVDDDSLTRAIGDKYPQYLKDDGFAADYSRLIDTGGQLTFSEPPGFTRTSSTGESISVTPPVTEGALPQGEPISLPERYDAIKGNPPSLGGVDLGPSEEAPAGVGALLGEVGNVARGVVADAAVGLQMGQSKKDSDKTAQYSGNVMAALGGEPLPIDKAIEASALEAAGEGRFPTEALVAHTSQGLAAATPIIGGVIGLPAWGQRLASLGFTVDMIRHAPELFKEYAEEINKPKAAQDPNKIAQLTSGIAQTFTFAPLAGKHAAAGVPASAANPRFNLETGFAPRTAEVVAAIEPKVEVAPIVKSPEVINLERSGAPLTAKAVESIAAKETVVEKPLNPGGALKDLSPELQAKSNSVKEAMAAEFERLRAEVAAKEAPPSAPVEQVKIGKSPQPYTVLERLAQSEIERANNEQSIRVRNNKTGEEMVVDVGSTTPIKAKAPKAQGSLAPAPMFPSATASPTTPVPVKSQRAMIEDLSKALQLPIRFGRLTTPKYEGYFKQIADLIGIKKASDVPVAAHESGHKLDTMFGLSKDPAIATELNKLGDPATPGSASSWTSSKGIDYKMGEGVAEFTRHWLIDPAKALADAPNTFAAFEKILAANKDLGDALRQTQSDIQVWKTAPPQSRLRAQISVGENPNKTRYTASQLTRDVLDDLHILNRATKEAGDLLPSKDPYLAARNLRGSYGMAETFINKGVVDFKTKEVNLGSSLEHALKPVAGRLNDFRDWIVAKRAQELQSQGRETGIIPDDANAVAAKFDADPIFQKAFSDIKAWNDSLLKYAVDAGLVSKTSAEAMRNMNSDYVPFHRLFEIGAGEAPSQSSSGIGMGLNVGKPGSLKGLKGSTRQIVDPLETMVKNAYSIVTASEKAAINKSVAGLADKPGMGKWVEKVATPKEEVKVELKRIRDELEKAGADLTKVPDDLILSFFKSSQKTPFGENIIKVIKDGEPEFYRLEKDLHDTFKALDLEDSSMAIRIASAPAQLLRSGVVLEPTFALANALRDAFGSAIISRHGAKPFEATLRGFAAMIGNEKLVAEWAAAGGKSAIEPAFFDRKKMQRYMAEKISKDLTPAERATIVIGSPLRGLRMLTEAFENATRIGEYEIALRDLRSKGMPEGEARRLAAFESRDRQDFAMGGAKTKIIRHMAPFWNAAVQGNYRLFKSFKERPLATTVKGLAYITTVKLAEQALNWNDEDYWDRPQWERDAFFMIPNGKDESGHTKFVRLPVPFLPGFMFGTLPGRVMQYLKKKDPKAGEGLLKQFAKETIPIPSFPLASAVYENFLTGPRGWDVFRSRQVVPERLVDLPPELQFTEQTSRAAKEIGKVLGISPVKIDHFIEQTTGGMGKLMSGRQRFGQRFQTAPLNVSSEVEAKFYELLQEEETMKALGQPTAGIAGVYSQLISTLRKAERAETDAKEKEKLREQIFQLEKQAVNLQK